MPKGDVETVFADGAWTNHVEGESAIGASYQTKEHAIDAGRELARQRNVQHVIRDQEGIVGDGTGPHEVEG